MSFVGIYYSSYLVCPKCHSQIQQLAEGYDDPHEAEKEKQKLTSAKLSLWFFNSGLMCFDVSGWQM